MAVVRKRRRGTMPPEGEGSEHWHQSRFFAVIRKLPHMAADPHITFSHTNGFLRTPAMRLRAWREGASAGIFDVQSTRPGDGKTLWMDFKVGKNQLTEDQERFRRMREAIGDQCDVPRSWQDALSTWCAFHGIAIELET